MAAVVAVVGARGGKIVCERCLVAATPLRRLRGLLGRASLARGEGILLRPVSAIHTSFMRFAIDVVFLDADLVVIDVVEALRPWRAAARRGAHAVLELAPGEARRRHVRAGERLAILSAGAGSPQHAS